MMHMRREPLIAIIIVIVVILLGVWWWQSHKATPVAHTTPTTTNNQISNGASNLPPLGTLATANDIVVDKPKTSDTVSSPITVSGKARGSWYFEASAPVVVIDTDGRVLGQGHINATGDWMTTDFVPFTGSIDFTLASASPATGALVFFNDNPSGMASTSKYLAVPIYFKQ